jgi:putative membrane protein
VTFGVVIVSLLAGYLLDLWWYQLKPVTLVGAQFVTMLCALLILWALPWTRIHFVPLAHRYSRAHDNAMKQFLSRNIHVTTARTGVMLFVSRAERYAEIIADSGINSRVSQETWDGVVAALIAHSRRGRVADGFVEAVGSVGVLLAQHFPAADGDANELDDHVVEI